MTIISFWEWSWIYKSPIKSIITFMTLSNLPQNSVSNWKLDHKASQQQCSWKRFLLLTELITSIVIIRQVQDYVLQNIEIVRVLKRRHHSKSAMKKYCCIKKVHVYSTPGMPPEHTCCSFEAEIYTYTILLLYRTNVAVERSNQNTYSVVIPAWINEAVVTVTVVTIWLDDQMNIS